MPTLVVGIFASTRVEVRASARRGPKTSRLARRGGGQAGKFGQQVIPMTTVQTVLRFTRSVSFPNLTRVRTRNGEKSLQRPFMTMSLLAEYGVNPVVSLTAVAARHALLPNRIRWYVLRPLLATLWIEQGRGVAPMRFQELVDAIVTEPALRDAIDHLLAIKRAALESEYGQPLPTINAFIDSELSRPDSVLPPLPRDTNFSVLDRLLMKTVLSLDAEGDA